MDDKVPNVTIGISPNATFSSVDGGSQIKIDDVPNERITLTKEYKNAREALKATG